MNNDPRSTQGGGTVIGVVVGIVLGLALATVVALYITNAPVPFLERVKRPTANVDPTAGGVLPDPNRPLQAPPPGGTPQASAAAPPPAAAPAAGKNDGAGTDTPKLPAGTAAVATAPATSAPAATEPETTRFMLQAGAFKSAEDADAMRAQIAMLGMEAKIFPVDSAGSTLYRVRLGPYGQRAEMERIQKALASHKVNTQIIALK